jgi:hypothetical protein
LLNFLRALQIYEIFLFQQNLLQEKDRFFSALFCILLRVKYFESNKKNNCLIWIA